MRRLPTGWECNIHKCNHHDARGSENSCNSGRLETCPIASGFLEDSDKEALLVGRIALGDNERLSATHAYFLGKKQAREDVVK